MFLGKCLHGFGLIMFAGIEKVECLYDNKKLLFLNKKMTSFISTSFVFLLISI